MKFLKQAQTVLALGVMTLAASAAATTYSGSFATTITDNDPVGNDSTITITDTGVITGLTVDVTMDHTWVGDLIMTLTSADGTVLTLMDRPGVPATGFGTNLDIASISFDDTATLAAEDVVTGGTEPADLFVSPDDMLASLAGESLAGVWTLNISDNAGGDLNNIAPTWSLNIDTAPVPVPAALWLMLSALGGLRLMRRR
ncbi:MAG: proprotein convertase P-domain-containing protein [Gammaproteobacteria bacterium]